MAKCLTANHMLSMKWNNTIQYAMNCSLIFCRQFTFSFQFNSDSPLSSLAFDTPRQQIMKCSEELVYIQVSRVGDGPQYMCAWLYLCARFPFFNSLVSGSWFPIRHVNVGIRLTLPHNMCPPFSICCMAMPRLRLFFILVLWCQVVHRSTN